MERIEGYFLKYHRLSNRLITVKHYKSFSCQNILSILILIWQTIVNNKIIFIAAKFFFLNQVDWSVWHTQVRMTTNIFWTKSSKLQWKHTEFKYALCLTWRRWILAPVSSVPTKTCTAEGTTRLGTIPILNTWIGLTKV